jgi:hypothetical protein
MAQYCELGPELIQGLRELAAAQENPATLAWDYASARRIARLVLGTVVPGPPGDLEPLRMEIRALRAENDAYQERISVLTEELSRERRTVAVLNDAASRPPKADLILQKIPDPPLFEGTRAKLRQFLPQLRLKVPEPSSASSFHN